MAEFKELYGAPEIYDIVFKRDVSGELDFFQRAFEAIANQRVGSCLEIACGPGYHTRAFAQRQVEAWGIDLEPEMIQFAERQACEAGQDMARFIVADMRDFQLGRTFDIAIAMLDGIDSMLTNAELRDHFLSVADHLGRGGVYFLDNMHPRDVSVTSYEPVVYAGRAGRRSAMIEYGFEPPQIDLSRAVADTPCRTRVYLDGRLVQEFVSRAKERFTTIQEIDAIAQWSGRFRVAGTWGNFDIDQRFDGSDSAERMIVALEVQ